MDARVIHDAIEEALAKAKKDGITGKDVTPYLLDFLATRTEGSSLKSNIALVMNNARVAADIAVAHAGKKWERKSF